MNSYTAFVSDLDGTLLNSDHSVPPEYDEIYDFLKLHGLPLIVASARPLGNIRQLFRGRPTPDGIVACDGAIVACFRHGLISHYTENLVSSERVRELLGHIDAHGLKPILFLTRENDYTVVVRDWDEVLIASLGLSDSTRPVVQAPKDEFGYILSNAEVRAISAFDQRDRVHSACKRIVAATCHHSEIRVYSYDESRFGSGRYAWLDGVSNVTRKIDAIVTIFTALGVGRPNFIGCGNGENDLQFLTDAKLRLCPANAVKSVLSVCKSDTSPFNEGGPFLRWVCDKIKHAINEADDVDRNDHSRPN
jgi:hydroxymethylpyrimidine pyrophosphatase-like HAD family hydrolase